MAGIEIVGLVATIGQLVETSLKGYKLFMDVKSFDRDYEECHLDFQIAAQILQDWGKKYSDKLEMMSIERRRLVFKILSVIAGIFASVKKSLYPFRLVSKSCQITPTKPTISIPDIVGQTSGMNRMMRW